MENNDSAKINKQKDDKNVRKEAKTDLFKLISAIISVNSRSPISQFSAKITARATPRSADNTPKI